MTASISKPQPSLASHILHREEGTGHVATVELLPRQKLDVTDHIALFIDHIRGHGVASYYLTMLFDIAFLNNNSMIAVWPDPSSLRKVWLVRIGKFPVGLRPTKLAGTCCSRRSSEEGKDRGLGLGRQLCIASWGCALIFVLPNWHASTVSSAALHAPRMRVLWWLDLNFLPWWCVWWMHSYCARIGIIRPCNSQFAALFVM